MKPFSHSNQLTCIFAHYSPESLTEEEIESKFKSLSLAFKTDKSTLEQRVELQKHYQDVAKKDATKEIAMLHESVRNINEFISSLSQDWFCSSDTRIFMRELMAKVHENIDLLDRCLNIVAVRGELYGAVQEEQRLNKAFDLILLYTENLKRFRDKEKKELEEYKKLSNSLSRKSLLGGLGDSESGTVDDDSRRSIKLNNKTVSFVHNGWEKWWWLIEKKSMFWRFIQFSESIGFHFS